MGGGRIGLRRHIVALVNLIEGLHGSRRPDRGEGPRADRTGDDPRREPASPPRERGLDPEAVVEGMEAATHMVLQLCGGEPSELVVAGKAPEWRRSFSLRKQRVATLGGVDVPPAEQRRILEALGFSVADRGEAFEVSPPSWRSDIHGEADLVEEIGRIWGFDRIQAVSMPRDAALPAPAISPAKTWAGVAGALAAARALRELMQYLRPLVHLTCHLLAHRCLQLLQGLEI